MLKQPMDKGKLLKVSIGVNHGELVTVIGPNGAGKTTLIKATMGLMELKPADTV